MEEKSERKLKEDLSFKNFSILPSDALLKILNKLSYTSRKKVTKSFGKQLPKVKEKVFIILQELLTKSFNLHYIEHNKKPHLGYPYFSQDEAYKLISDNWNQVRSFLVSNNVIQIYLNKKGKPSYSNGSDGVSEKFPMRWRLNPKYYSAKYFEFQPIIDKELDSVTLHDSVDQHFDKIVKLRQWNKYTEFIQKYQVHVFNYKSINHTIVTKHGREFNKVNTLPREVREFVLIDGVETETLDFSSCSLTILYPLITEINGERSSWLEMLNHPQGAYKHIAEITGHTRDEVKKDVVRWIGCRGKNTRRQQFIMNKFLAQHLHITYTDIQNGDIDLVAYTQEVESNIIVKQLGDKGISIHDAIVTKYTNVEEVHELMQILMGHFTSGKDVGNFDELDLMFSDHHLNGVTGKPKLEVKVIRKKKK